MAGWVLDRVTNINERDLTIILNVIAKYEGKEYDGLKIMQDLIDANYIEKPEFEPDDRIKVLKKKWGSYVGIINAYGLAYYTNGIIELSEISKAFLKREIIYRDFIRIQMSKWQLPNSALQASTIKEYTDLSICLKPFIATLKVLYKLKKQHSEDEAWLDMYDIVVHLETLKTHNDDDIVNAVQNIISDRKSRKSREVSKIGAEDIVFNTFCETGYLKKYNKIIVKLGGIQQSIRGAYSISEEYLEEIEGYIEKFGGELLDTSPHTGNKEKWLRDYGEWNRELFLNQRMDEMVNDIRAVNFNVYVKCFENLEYDQFIFDETFDINKYKCKDEIFVFSKEDKAITHLLKVIAVSNGQVCVRVLYKFNPLITVEKIVNDDDIMDELKGWIMQFENLTIS